MMAHSEATGDGLEAKLERLGRVTRGLPAGLRDLCRARMTAGHHEHAGEPLEDWRAEAAEEVADGICYCSLGGARGLRVTVAVAALGLVWRLTVTARGGRYSLQSSDNGREVRRGC